MNQENITPYQDINEILFQISKEVRRIISEKLIGVYLTGSFSYGDFNYDSSDVDLIVIVKEPCTHPEIDQIKALHRKIEAQYPRWAERVECSYTPVEMFKNTLPPKDPRPWYGGGIFYEEAPYGNEWIINSYLLYKHGIPLMGPDVKELIPLVSMIEVQKACIRDLFQEWVPKIEDVEWFNNSHYQSYFVMNLCRILYTVICGATASKKVSATWVKKEFGKSCQELIETAENWVYGKEMNARDEAIYFLKFVVEKVKETELYTQIYPAILPGSVN